MNFPDLIRKFTKTLGTPELGWPAASRVKNRIALSDPLKCFFCLALMSGVDLNWELKVASVVRYRNTEGTVHETKVFANYVGFLGNSDRLRQQKPTGWLPEPFAREAKNATRAG